MARFGVIVVRFGVGVLGVAANFGVLGLLSGLGEGLRPSELVTGSLRCDDANFLAAGDMVASLSIVDVLGLGEGLKFFISY